MVFTTLPRCTSGKSTTKTRIVFDASASFQQVALNDKLLTGQKLQRNLLEVLIRFRKAPIALSCDISEMYLQIKVDQDDHWFLCFLWRELENRPPDVYEFNRVVFGLCSSPFLAQFVTQEHARKHTDEFL